MTQQLLPSPVDLGLPAKFTRWWPGQDKAIIFALEAERRFVGMVQPTGAGKSLIYMAIARILAGGGRTVILTATKALQRQLQREFYTLEDTVLMQGQRAYLCHALSIGGELWASHGRGLSHGEEVTVDQAPCHVGAECKLKMSGCTYYDAFRAALRASIVITNYAWWFTLVERQDVRLTADLLILDEAHAAPDALADALGADVHERDVKDLLHGELGKAAGRTADEWHGWALAGSNRLAQMLAGTKPNNHETTKRLRRAQWLHRSLLRVARVDPQLLLVSDQPKGVRFDLVWAAPYAESHLFRGTKRVILTSATFTTFVAELMGVAPNTLSLYDVGEGFPIARRPVYILPATRYGISPIRVGHAMTVEEISCWVEHIDRIIDARLDRKGIVHTVSYTRRDALLTQSRHRARMVTHNRENTASQIQKFKQAEAGAILVSPSVTTGYDFPYNECEYQIIAKVPFPDSRDPVTKLRTQIDARYPYHVAAREIVQAVGRGMRAADDRCENFIVDEHARWFFRKYGSLTPRWFRRAFVSVTEIPAPPPPLPRHATPAGSDEDDA